MGQFYKCAKSAGDRNTFPIRSLCIQVTYWVVVISELYRQQFYSRINNKLHFKTQKKYKKFEWIPQKIPLWFDPNIPNLGGNQSHSVNHWNWKFQRYFVQFTYLGTISVSIFSICLGFIKLLFLINKLLNLTQGCASWII